MEEDTNGNDAEFVLAVARNLKRELDRLLADKDSKLRRVLTETHLLATVLAVNDVVIGCPPYSPWPANGPPTLDVSADKETQWLRETLTTCGLKNIELSACRGSNLDLQIRQGDRVLVNMESELGGNRQRAQDMAKLVRHDTQPRISIMMVREKSHKNVDRTFRNLAAASARRPEYFVNVVEHWPDNSVLSAATTIIAVAHRGKICSAVESCEVELGGIGGEEMDER